MFINHIKISVRNLWKNKTLSLLNLIGLSIGIASVLALMFSVYKYYTADDLIKNKDDIYYLKTYLKDGNDVREVPYPMRDKVLSSSTDIIEATPLHSWGNIWLESDGKDFQKNLRSSKMLIDVLRFSQISEDSRRFSEMFVDYR